MIPAPPLPRPGIILAGGASSRMGCDKAMLPIDPDGTPMLFRIARTLSTVSTNLTIVGRAQPSQWPADLPVIFLRDKSAPAFQSNTSAGPLIGLITALEHHQSALLVIACDLPLITTETLRGLLTAHRPESLATIAIGTQPEPTLAIYTPALLPQLQSMLQQNRRSLQPLTQLPGIALHQISPEDQWQLLNVNDPDSLAQAQTLAMQK